MVRNGFRDHVGLNYCAFLIVIREHIIFKIAHQGCLSCFNSENLKTFNGKVAPQQKEKMKSGKLFFFVLLKVYKTLREV